jgi:uncharacterized protein (TIGR02611 family)
VACVSVGEREDERAARQRRSGGQGDKGRVRTWASARRAQIARRRSLDIAWRTGVFVVGLLIIAAGLALLPLPGPGWLIVFLGLGLLATEFTWAKRLLRFARDRVRAWTDWVSRQSIAIRALLAVAAATVVVAAVWGYLAVAGPPGWLPDSATSWLPGVDPAQG